MKLIACVFPVLGFIFLCSLAGVDWNFGQFQIGFFECWFNHNEPLSLTFCRGLGRVMGILSTFFTSVIVTFISVSLSIFCWNNTLFGTYEK